MPVDPELKKTSRACRTLRQDFEVFEKQYAELFENLEVRRKTSTPCQALYELTTKLHGFFDRIGLPGRIDPTSHVERARQERQELEAAKLKEREKQLREERAQKERTEVEEKELEGEGAPRQKGRRVRRG